jgi:hypothetical protein
MPAACARARNVVKRIVFEQHALWVNPLPTPCPPRGLRCTCWRAQAAVVEEIAGAGNVPVPSLGEANRPV